METFWYRLTYLGCPDKWLLNSHRVFVARVHCSVSYAPASRETVAATVADVGTVFRLKGAVVHLSFVDLNGALVQPVAEPWKDAGRTDDSADRKDRNSCSSTLLSSVDFKLHCGGTNVCSDVVRKKNNISVSWAVVLFYRQACSGGLL